MKFIIKYESRERMRIHISGYKMTYTQADTLLYFLKNQAEVILAKVYDRTGDAAIVYMGNRERLIEVLQQFHYEDIELPTAVLENSGRELTHQYQKKW